MRKITRITKHHNFEKVLDEIREGLRDNTIDHIAIVARKRNEGKGVILRYWYGVKSSVYILGLLEYMKHHINVWIESDGDLDDE